MRDEVFDYQTRGMKKHRIYTTSFASVYPHYVNKAEAKGRRKQEVDEVMAERSWRQRIGADPQLRCARFARLQDGRLVLIPEPARAVEHDVKVG